MRFLASQSTGRLIAIRTLSILVGLAFLASGALKLGGYSNAIMIFEKVGIGQWFRYVTGVLEMTGGIGLFFPRYRFYAALLLAWIMFCAMNVHFFRIGGNWVPSAVLLLLTGIIAWLSAPRRHRGSQA